MPPAPSPVVYTVLVRLPDHATAAEYLAWLLGSPTQSGHVDDVIRAGAESAAVMRSAESEQDAYIEVQYLFTNHESLNTYLTNHAPRLRAEGLRRFPIDRGVRFERRVGTLVAARNRTADQGQSPGA